MCPNGVRCAPVFQNFHGEKARACEAVLPHRKISAGFQAFSMPVSFLVAFLFCKYFFIGFLDPLFYSPADIGFTLVNSIFYSPFYHKV